MTLRLGQEGHVCFRLLAPNIVSSAQVPVARDPLTNEPTAWVADNRVDGTIDTGETACHWGHVVNLNEDGTVNVSGANARGEPWHWRDVQVGAQPEPVTTPGREDPAGHTFHLPADCPWGR